MLTGSRMRSIDRAGHRVSWLRCETRLVVQTMCPVDGGNVGSAIRDILTVGAARSVGECVLRGDVGSLWGVGSWMKVGLGVFNSRRVIV